jgi:hypothetical protein
MEGTPIVIGFYCGSQLPDIDERKFNNGVPYVDAAQVLSLLPFASRAAWLTVNIAGVEWVFVDSDPLLETLVEKIGTLSLSNGQVTLVKMASMDALSIIGNTSGSSATPQYITFAAFKVILELSNINTGDETTATIKTKLGIMTLSGSNTGDETTSSIKSKLSITILSGSNTGDETLASIKSKLSITTLSGDNTGDQDLSGKVDKVTGYGLSKNDYSDAEKAKVAAAIQVEYQITLPSASTVAGRCAGTIVVPTGFTVAAGVVPEDLVVTHNLHRKMCLMSVESVDGATFDSTNLTGGLAYMNFKNDRYGNVTTIKGFATIETQVLVHLFFGSSIITQPS